VRRNASRSSFTLLERAASRIFGWLLFAVHALPLVLVVLVIAAAAEGWLASDEASGSIAATSIGLSRWVPLLSSTGVALVVGLPIHIVLAAFLGASAFRSSLPSRRVAQAFLVLGALVPFYVSATAWIGILGEGHLFRDLVGSAAAVGVLHALAQAPLGAVVCGLAFRAVPRALEEQALMDGASRIEAIVRVVVPAGRIGVAATAILFVATLLTDYTVSDLLVVRTFAEEVYTLFALGEPGRAIVAAIPPFLLLFLLAVPLVRAASEGGWHSAGGSGSVPLRRDARSSSAGLLLTLVCAGLALLPIASLGRHLEPHHGLFSTVRAFDVEIITSTTTALAAGVACAILAPGIAWAIARRKTRGALVIWTATALALPGPLAGIGLIRLLDHPGPLGAIYDSTFVLVLAYIVRFFAVALLLALPSIRALPPAREEAARVEGLRASGIWFRVILPASRFAFARIALVIAALSVGELVASHLVVPPGADTVGRRFFSLVHYGLRGEAAALSLLGLGCTFVPWLLLVGIEELARHQRSKES